MIANVWGDERVVGEGKREERGGRGRTKGAGRGRRSGGRGKREEEGGWEGGTRRVEGLGLGGFAPTVAVG